MLNPGGPQASKRKSAPEASESGGVSTSIDWVTVLQWVIREVTDSSNDQAAYKRLRSFLGRGL